MIERLKKFFPTSIRTIAVVSPAGFPEAGKYAAELQLLRSANFNIKEYLPCRNVNTPSYLAGDAIDRIRAFNRAVNDPEVDLILCSRGGFGCVHLLEQIDYATLRKRNLPVMGYSDITALHCAMLAKNSGAAIAGSNLLGISKIAGDDFSYQAHRAALSKEKTVITLPQALESLPNDAMQNQITAKAYAANLTVLASLCGTEYLPDFKNMILILEDINEAVYKLDRMLNQLALNGVFRNISALVFGDFSGSEATEAAALMERFARTLQVPCFKNFPFGHTLPVCAINSQRAITLQSSDQLYFEAF